MVPASLNNKHLPATTQRRSRSLAAATTLSKYRVPLGYSSTLLLWFSSTHNHGASLPSFCFLPTFFIFWPVASLLSSELSRGPLFLCVLAKDNTRVSEGMPPRTLLEVDGNFPPIHGVSHCGVSFWNSHGLHLFSKCFSYITYYSTAITDHKMLRNSKTNKKWGWTTVTFWS